MDNESQTVLSFFVSQSIKLLEKNSEKAEQINDKLEKFKEIVA